MIRFLSLIFLVFNTSLYTHTSLGDVPDIVLPLVELELKSIERNEWPTGEGRKTVPSLKFTLKSSSTRDLSKSMEYFSCREIWPSSPINDTDYISVARDYGSSQIQYGTVWAVFSNVRPVEIPGNPYGPKGLKRGVCFYDKISFESVRLGYVSEIDSTSASLQSITVRNTFVRRALYRSPDNIEKRSLEFAFQPAGKFFWISDEDKTKGIAACERIVLSRQVSNQEINDALFWRDRTYEFQNIRYSNIDSICLADNVKRANSDVKKHELEFLNSGQVIGDVKGTIKLATGIGVALERESVDNNRFTKECISSANRRWNEGNEIKARLKKGMRILLTSVRVSERHRCDFARLIVLPPNQSKRKSAHDLGDVVGRAFSFSEYGYHLQETARYKTVPSKISMNVTEFEKKCRSVVFPLEGSPMEKGIAEWLPVVAKKVFYLNGRCYAEQFEFSQLDTTGDLYNHPEWVSLEHLESSSKKQSFTKKKLTKKVRPKSSRPPVASTVEGFITGYSSNSRLKNLLVLNPYIQEPRDNKGKLLSCDAFQYMPSSGTTGMTTPRLENYAYWYDLSFQKIAVRLLGVKSGTDKNRRCTFTEALAIDENGKEIPRPSTFFDRSIIDKLDLTKWYDDCLGGNSRQVAHIGFLEYCTCKTVRMSEDAVKVLGQPLNSIRTPVKKLKELSKLINMSDYYCQNPDHYKTAISGSNKAGVNAVATTSSGSTSKSKSKSKSSQEITENTNKPFVLSEFGHFTVIPTDPNAPIAADIKSLWAKGFYIHLKANGNFGFNTDKPGPYHYLPVNSWKQNNGVFTLILDKMTYTFTLPKNEHTGETTLTTIDTTLNAFKMTYVTKGKGEQ